MVITQTPSYMEEVTYLSMSHFLCDMVSEAVVLSLSNGHQPKSLAGKITLSLAKNFAFLAVRQLENYAIEFVPIKTINQNLAILAGFLISLNVITNHQNQPLQIKTLELCAGALTGFASYYAIEAFDQPSLAGAHKSWSAYKDFDYELSKAMKYGLANSYSIVWTKDMQKDNYDAIFNHHFIDTFAFSMPLEYTAGKEFSMTQWTADNTKLSFVALMPAIMSVKSIPEILIDYSTFVLSVMALADLHNSNLVTVVGESKSSDTPDF